MITKELQNMKPLRGDEHLSNAWTTRNREEAAEAVRKYGGTPMLFNPIIWKVKKL